MTEIIAPSEPTSAQSRARAAQTHILPGSAPSVPVKVTTAPVRAAVVALKAAGIPTAEVAQVRAGSAVSNYTRPQRPSIIPSQVSNPPKLSGA